MNRSQLFMIVKITSSLSEYFIANTLHTHSVCTHKNIDIRGLHIFIYLTYYMYLVVSSYERMYSKIKKNST